MSRPDRESITLSPNPFGVACGFDSNSEHPANQDIQATL